MGSDPYHWSSHVYDLAVEPLNRKLRRIGLAFSAPAAGAWVLDVGCGTGTQLELYREVGRCVAHGLEFSPAMLAVARRRLPADSLLVRGDGARLPWRDDSFDLAMISLVLHELSATKRAGVLAELGRVVRPGGQVLVSDFHPGPYTGLRGWALRKMILGIEHLAGAEHFRHQSEFIAAGGLPGLARQVGLDLVRAKVLGRGNIGLYLLAPRAC